MPALLADQPAVVVQCPCIHRVDRQRAAKTLFGKQSVPQAHINQAAQIIGVAKSRVCSDRLLEFIERDGGLSILEVAQRQFQTNARALAWQWFVRIGHQVGPGTADKISWRARD